MADRDDKTEMGAPVPAASSTALDVAAEPLSATVAVPAKRALRRQILSPDKTALSSPATVVTPPAGVGQAPAAQVSKAGAAKSKVAGSPAGKAPFASSALANPAIAKAVPTKPVPVKTAPVKAQAKPVAAKSLPLKPAAAPAKPVSTAPAYPRSKIASGHGPVSAPAPRATEPVSTATPVTPPVSYLKDKTMDMSANFSSFQDAMSQAQAKAQAAFEKSSTAMGEAGEFAKGNVEAFIASGKILAEGVQEIGGSMVAEGRTAFESMTADIKELAAAKSPTDFLKIQGDMVRKNFDTAVAYGSKNSETFLKLMSDAFAPISGRVSLAVEKVRQAAPTTTAAPL